MRMYITFGQTHVHSVNGKTFDKNCVAVFDCFTSKDGREKANTYFNKQYHNSYTEFHEVNMEYYPRGLIEVEKNND